MIKHLTIKLYGKVQGVFFRETSKKMAEKFGIVGSVQNLPDGSVQIEAEGEENKLGEFLGWSKEGPVKAIVEKVKVSSGEVKNYSSFKII